MNTSPPSRESHRSWSKFVKEALAHTFYNLLDGIFAALSIFKRLSCHSFIIYLVGLLIGIALLFVIGRYIFLSAVGSLAPAFSVMVNPLGLDFSNLFSVCDDNHIAHHVLPRRFCRTWQRQNGGSALTEDEREDIARRYGIAVVAEGGMKNMSDIVHWVVKTPSSPRIQSIVQSASTMSMAFRHKTDLVSKEAISKDFDRIADKADHLIDTVINVETNGRTIAKDMISGYEEVLHMLAQPSTYTSVQLESRLDKHLLFMEKRMEELQEMLQSAQSVASETLSVQKSLMGKLYAEQTDMEDLEMKFLDANSIMNKIWGAKPDLNEVQYQKVKRNLELCTFAVEEMQDWSRHFGGYLLYLRTYRAQVKMGRRQLDEHVWATDGLTLEDRIKSMSKLIEPAKERLRTYEEGHLAQNNKRLAANAHQASIDAN